MANNYKTPAIRFKGFTDAWEQRKLGELANVKDSARISNDLWSDSGVPYIRASDLSNNDLSGVLFLSEETYSFYKNQTGAPILGDLLFNGGGEIGKAVLKRDDKPIYVQGGAVLYVQTSSATELVGEYLESYFQSPLAKKYIDIASAGVTMKHFTLGPSQEMPIIYPSLDEQRKIGDYFRNLDTLITLHQRKCNKLIQFKAAMLQKMFPQKGANKPEIRFRGFTDAWEQRKVSSLITDIADGPFGSNLKTEHYTDEKEARIIQLSNLSDNGWQEENTRYTTFEHANEIKRCIVNEGELVMGKMMPAGMTIIRPNTEKMYVLSSDCVRIKLDNNIAINKFFLYTTKSDTFLNQVNNDSQGSTRIRTSISKIRDMDISLPSVPEQEKIGEYFTNLDTLITIHQRECDKYKSIKAGLIRKLFPME